MQQLPAEFIQNIRSLLGENAGEFLNGVLHEPVTSVRLNRLKPVDKFGSDEKVAWCERGRYLADRPSFIADPLFHAGAYYVQEASSMFIGHIVKQVVKKEKPLRVLDLCAAPGGKSTLLLDLLEDDDLLVSNEMIRSRVHILEENLVRWGRSNIVITNNDPKDFTQLTGFFDVILVDAPCSGEGMFRKDPDAIEEWSEDNVNLCAVRQKRILANVIPALKPGGLLIYSTCTFNTKENEENVHWMMKEHELLSVRTDVDESWGITETTSFDNEPLFACRFYPHKVKGEGLFAACLQKPFDAESKVLKIGEPKVERLKKPDVAVVGEWIRDADRFEMILEHGSVYALPSVLMNDIYMLRSKLHVRLSGLKAGELIRQSFLPEHQLALSVNIHPAVPAIELTLNEALTFLKKETFPVAGKPQGIYLVTFNGCGIGWIKVLANRINNYLPTNLRILKDIGSL